MKKSCAFFFVVLTVAILLSSFVFAQTVPSSDFKVTLIDAIKDYLTSQTPKLEKNELKDLIVAYLISSGDNVDLSKTGTYSGEKLETIYNKVKGKPCTPSCVGRCGGESDGCTGFCNAPCQQCSHYYGSGICKSDCNIYEDCWEVVPYPASAACKTGKCCKGMCKKLLNFAEIAKSAAKLDQPVGDTGFYGYMNKNCAAGSGDYLIPAGKAVWFLLDPKGFTGKSNPTIYMAFKDCAQDDNLAVTVYIIDASDNLMSPQDAGYGANPLPIGLNVNTSTWSSKHSDTKRYLIKVEDYRGKDTKYNVYWTM